MKGFTLLEMIVVIVIIGVLATLGFRQYMPVRESALSREAVANLRLIRAAERIYRMETTTYYPATGTENNIGNINNNLKLSLTTNNWGYSITTTNAAPPTFTATADRVGTGGYLDCQWSINQGQDNPIVVTDTLCMQ